ncbi:MAG: hypothetical protein HY287_06185 [Planctomycetes bacterium]|nr:hypothetical protein [Planctomycetota bacterium]MBI3833902.1 hypothetical protein [Planctomycetota bacterium]
MFRTIRIRSIVIALFVLTARDLRAEEPAAPPPTAAPVYSLEAAEINGKPIPGGSMSRISIAPGDTIKIKMMLRDWSPKGEKLRGYQAMIDSSSYTSGEGGAVQPVDYNKVPDNGANAYIDRKSPQYIFPGLDSFPVVDAGHPDYRWMNVLLNKDTDSPGCKQDGKKYECMGLNMQATPDANGTFTIKLSANPDATSLLTSEDKSVDGLKLEPLIVEVSTKNVQNRIVSTDPPDGAVDARRNKSGHSWDSLQLTLNVPPKDLTPKDFTIEDGSPSPPKITRVNADGSVVVLTLDHAIRTGAWTTVTFPSAGKFKVGALPGDVDNDGETNSNDVSALIDAMNGTKRLPLYRTDIDGDGALTSRDLSALVDILSNADSTPIRLKK